IEPAAQVDGTPPAHAQRLVEPDVGLDDARVDHDLTYRDVQLGDDAAQFIQLVLGFQGNDAVGAIIHGDRTPLLTLTRSDRRKQGRNVRSLGVIHLDQLTAQRRQFGDLLLGFQLLAFAGGDLFSGRDQQHVTYLALVQTLGFQYQIQRLVPRHIPQPPGDTALHRVTGHQVEVGEVGDQLQDRTHFDVLEVE